eukprot:764153-Hanusia_phi.AAC.4
MKKQTKECKEVKLWEQGDYWSSRSRSRRYTGRRRFPPVVTGFRSDESKSASEIVPDTDRKTGRQREREREREVGRETGRKQDRKFERTKDRQAALFDPMTQAPVSHAILQGLKDESEALLHDGFLLFTQPLEASERWSGRDLVEKQNTEKLFFLKSDMPA